MSRSRIALVSAIPLLIACPVLAQGTSNGSIVCAVAGNQALPHSIPDGSGGAIIAWRDERGGVSDVYAQRVLATGVADPAWPANGLAVCTASDQQQSLVIVPSGANAAVIAWQDYRSGNWDIYAQRILFSGTADPSWPVNGRLVCSATGDQVLPTIASDGADGVVVAWMDCRSVSDCDIYAQHVLASGFVDSSWPVNGLAVCTATNPQSAPSIASDDAGGAIVAWHDPRGGGFDVYAMRVLGTGALDPSWPVNGRALCAVPFEQSSPLIVRDGSGGAIVAWFDRRNTSGSYGDIYALRVLSSGLIDPSWPVDGRALCVLNEEQFLGAIAEDGSGGAVVTWQDYRGGNWDIYAQRVLGSGDVAWQANGRAVCVAPYDQVSSSVTPDAAGGALIAWADFRNGSTSDIYAQHILASGDLATGWHLDGRAICSARNGQSTPAISGDGAGGAVVSWTDSRNTNPDLYAQRVTADGIVLFPDKEAPTIVSVKDVPNDQGGLVRVSWKASSLDPDPPYLIGSYWIWRSAPPRIAKTSGTFLSRNPSELVNGQSGFLVTGNGISEEYWELVGSQQAGHLASYSLVTATTSDSLNGSNPRTAFLVQAWAGSDWWFSNPDSGYSVDNLPPNKPSAFAWAQLGSGNSVLTWLANEERDLVGYVLHRGPSPDFEPSSGTLVATTDRTSYVDGLTDETYYRLAALDAHGNLSSYALAGPNIPTSTGPGRDVLALEAIRPNPLVERDLVIAFSLASSESAQLELWDIAGRRLLSREVGGSPGPHTVLLGSASVLKSGKYVVRLTQGERTLARGVTVLR
jgi:hypothetical protein